MSESMRIKLRAAVVALAPVAALIGFLWHPYIADVTDRAAVAAAVGAGATRWAGSHLLLAVAFALAVLAVFALRVYLRGAGEDRWSFVAVPFVTVGMALVIVVLGAEGVAASAVASVGGDVTAFLAEVEAWLTPTYLLGAALLAAGWLSLAMAVSRSHVLDRPWTGAVAAGLIALAVLAFLPFGWATIGSGVAAVVAFWPLAYRIWAGPAEHEARVTGAQPSPA